MKFLPVAILSSTAVHAADEGFWNSYVQDYKCITPNSISEFPALSLADCATRCGKERATDLFIHDPQTNFCQCQAPPVVPPNPIEFKFPSRFSIFATPYCEDETQKISKIIVDRRFIGTLLGTPEELLPPYHYLPTIRNHDYSELGCATPADPIALADVKNQDQCSTECAKIDFDQFYYEKKQCVCMRYILESAAEPRGTFSWGSCKNPQHKIINKNTYKKMVLNKQYIAPVKETSPRPLLAIENGSAEDVSSVTEESTTQESSSDATQESSADATRESSANVPEATSSSSSSEQTADVPYNPYSTTTSSKPEPTKTCSRGACPKPTSPCNGSSCPSSSKPEPTNESTCNGGACRTPKPSKKVDYTAPSDDYSYEAPSDDQEDYSYEAPSNYEKVKPTCKDGLCPRKPNKNVNYGANYKEDFSYADPSEVTTYDKYVTRNAHKQKCVEKYGKDGKKPRHGMKSSSEEKKSSGEEKKIIGEEKKQEKKTAETKKEDVKDDEKVEKLSNAASGKLFSGSFIVALVVVVFLV